MGNRESIDNRVSIDNPVSIDGIDKVQLALELWLQVCPRELDSRKLHTLNKEAQMEVERTGGNLTSLSGVQINCDLSGDTVDPSHYERLHKSCKVKNAVEKCRQKARNDQSQSSSRTSTDRSATDVPKQSRAMQQSTTGLSAAYEWTEESCSSRDSRIWSRVAARVSEKKNRAD